MIELRQIKPEDLGEIKNWPAYADEFEQMDYALRDNGWLDEFRNRPGTWIYLIELSNQAIGFSLLGLTAEGEAEFRIALHPHWTGRDFGRKASLATLKTGFHLLNLDRIHLIVRKNNPRALKLYERLGFTKTGESNHSIQGRRTEFINMDMTREMFTQLNQKERE